MPAIITLHVSQVLTNAQIEELFGERLYNGQAEEALREWVLTETPEEFVGHGGTVEWSVSWVD